MTDVYEKNLDAKSSLEMTDFIRVVGSDTVSYKQLVSDVANKIITLYNGATLGGSAQTVQAAINGLATKFDSKAIQLIPRCKNITSYFTDGTLWSRIAGTGGYSAYEDIMPGDYIDMGRTVTCPNVDSGSSGATGSRYATVISCGGLYGCGDSNAVTYNHLVMTAGQGLGGTQHFGQHQMNATNTTTGGYVGSVMNTAVIGDVVSSGSVSTGATINQQLYYIFSSHLKTTREILSNAVTDGKSSGWAWTPIQAVLMSEAEVYGTNVWSSSAYDTGCAYKQFELFQQSRQAINNRSAYYWLKNVVSSSAFANSNIYGGANSTVASLTNYYVRPRFVLA